MMMVLSCLWIVWICLHSTESAFLLVAPEVLHYGVPETIHVTDVGGSAGTVSVVLKDYPAKSVSVGLIDGTPLLAGNHTTITIEAQYDIFPARSASDFTAHRYAYLVVAVAYDGVVNSTESVVRLSGDVARVWTQTDKPIYAPGEKVKLTVYATDLNGLPKKLRIRIDIQSPSGIVVQRDAVYTENPLSGGGKIPGVLLWTFSLRSHPALGAWSAVVYYGPISGSRTVFTEKKSLEFQVAKYDLPPFLCTLQDVPDVLLIGDTTELHHSVEARYTFGEPVDGTVTVRYGMADVEPPFYMVTKSRSLDKGQRDFTLNLTEIYSFMRMIYDNFDYEGNHLMISAECREEASGQVVGDSVTRTVFARSPFIFNFEHTPTHFKPHLLVIFHFQVLHANGRIAAGEHFQILSTARSINSLESARVITDKRGRAWMRVLGNANQQQFQFNITSSKTSVPGQFTMKRRTSLGGSDLSVTTTQLQHEVGDMLTVNMAIKDGPLCMINLMMITRGRVVATKLLQGPIDSYEVQSVHVTREMTPRVDILAVFMDSRSHIATTAAFGVYVEDHCKGKVTPDKATYSLDTDKKHADLHLSEFTPSSHVMLHMTDQALDALTPPSTQLFTLSRPSDCTPRDSADLGVGFSSDLLPVTSHRLPAATDCQSSGARRRRDADALDLDECCRRGSAFTRPACALQALRFVVQSDASSGRAESVACFERFTDCCRNATQQEPDVPWRSGGGLSKHDEYDIILAITDAGVRHQFPQAVVLGPVAIGDSGATTYKLHLHDSLTNWTVRSVSVSNTNGLCVPPPANFTVTKSIFLRVTLPTAAVRGETLLLEATVFNYRSNTPIDVSVHMTGVEGVCSAALPGAMSEPIHRTVDAKGAVTVQWPLVVLEAGIFHIKVFVRNRDRVADNIYKVYDVVRKVLHVVREGTRKTNYEVLQVNSAVSHKQCSMEDYRTTRCILTLPLPMDYVPESAIAKVKLIPTIFGPAEAIIASLDVVLDDHLSYGSASHVISNTAMAVYAYAYLPASHISTGLEERFFSVVRRGVAQIVSFRKDSGSLGEWLQGSGDSTWLTAYALKVFSRASDMSEQVDAALLDGFVTYLFTTQLRQGIDIGSFRETSSYDQMRGSLPLSARVLIALFEAQVDTAPFSIQHEDALTYLSNSFLTVENAYHAAMIAYALSPTRYGAETYRTLKTMAVEETINDVNVRHFGALKRSEAIQAASYAVLAALRHADIEYCHRLVTWLQYQRVHGSGLFRSTQDTILALQALAQYAEANIRPDPELTVQVWNGRTGQQLGEEVTITSKDRNMEFAVEVPPGDAERNFTASVTIKGVGDLQVILESSYNVRKEADHCPFVVSHHVSDYGADDASTLNKMGGRRTLDDEDIMPFDNPETVPPTTSKINVSVCVRSIDVQRVTVATIEMWMLTGYHPHKYHLDQLVHDGEISSYESSETVVKLYLTNVVQWKNTCVSVISLKQESAFQLSPAAIKVYDYYDPESHCVEFYSAEAGWRPIYQGHKCFEGVCATCYSGMHGEEPWTFKQFQEIRCLSVVTYVLRVKYINTTHVPNALHHYMEVRGNFKHGLFDYRPGTFVILEQPALCNCPNLQPDDIGKFFFVMGHQESERWGGGTRYVLGLNQDAYVERWNRSRKGPHWRFVRLLKSHCTT